MKLKVKITYGQFVELVTVIGKIPNKGIALSDIDYINLKQFYVQGLNKINTSDFTEIKKQKTFRIDINHYEAIRKVLEQFNQGIEYAVAIFLTIKYQVTPQIDRQLWNYRLTG